MDKEIACKLLALRKQNGLSQEELAEKLGISRQAVSKWERGESSPDTENLIALAKIYNISLDKLFNLDTGTESLREPISLKKKESTDEYGRRVMYPEGSAADEIYPDNSQNTDQMYHDNGYINYETPPSQKELQTYYRNSNYSDDSSNVSGNSSGNAKSGIGDMTVNEIYRKLMKFPYAVLCVILFFLMGAIDAWHPGWMVFLTIPLYYTAIPAVKYKDPNIFCYPVAVALVFLIFGFMCDTWHPGWIIFLTIPLYYWIANFWFNDKGNKKDTQSDNFS